MSKPIGMDMHLKASEDPNLFGEDGAMKELVEVFLTGMKEICRLKGTKPTHLILAWDNAPEGKGYELVNVNE